MATNILLLLVLRACTQGLKFYFNV